eukprot:5514678-Amphidinium_carterae.1
MLRESSYHLKPGTILELKVEEAAKPTQRFNIESFHHQPRMLSNLVQPWKLWRRKGSGPSLHEGPMSRENSCHQPISLSSLVQPTPRPNVTQELLPPTQTSLKLGTTLEVRGPMLRESSHHHPRHIPGLEQVRTCLRRKCS